MKTWFAFASVFAAVGLCSSFVGAAESHDTNVQPDYDKRTVARRSSVIVATQPAPNAVQDAALSGLRMRVPNVKVDRDEVLRAPRDIRASRGFLTGPGGHGLAVSKATLDAIPANDNHRVIKAFLNEHPGLFGHDARALNSARLKRDERTAHNGLRTVVWEQTLDGIPVFEGVMKGHVAREGELISVSSGFVVDAGRAADVGTPGRRALQARPRISAAQAIGIAATDIGANVSTSAIAASASEGAEKKQTATGPGLTLPAQLQLTWLPMNEDSMRLCWQVVLTANVGRMERYLVLVDAQSGEVLIRRLMTQRISNATYNVYTSDSPSPLSPGLSAPSLTQPPVTNRQMVTIAALSTNASPNGWINDGDNTTSGNNAIAFRDRNFDGAPDVPQPQGAGPGRVFDYPMDLAQEPVTYAPASTVQLFYSANWYHDRLYQLGFTEAAGNFQDDNFGRGGFGNDPIICLVQAGADSGFTDNAFYLPGFDGSSGYIAMFEFSGPIPNRDGSLDQEIVIHELTHGLSDRLVGGGIGISQLQTAGMGEGWSDFYALCLLSEPSDDLNGNYAAGAYATYQFLGFTSLENYYYGIRRYPYSTDMNRNPLTFKDIDPTQADPHFGIPTSPLFGGGQADEVHNQGEVWCMVLREVWANLVTKYGWSIGNELTLQLVTDGMKLGPANPNFLEARDAIIMADLVLTGGVNYDDIWIGFAKRGMGYSASSPGSFTTVGVVEAFDLPPDVIVGVEVPIGVMRVRITPPDQTAMFAGDTNSIFVRISDGLGVTNASISATLSTGGSIAFLNNGVAPDVGTNNHIYTASLVVPSALSVTINMVITAPGKDPSTNSVTYPIVPPPPNDYFTNATKVPVGGTNYLTINKRATLESGEPEHGGIGTSAHSLWWKYTAGANTNVLVDAGGSDFRAIVAVYTNNTLTSLQPKASAVGNLSRLGPYVSFNVTSGATYYIAVASYDDFTSGTVRLYVAPGGQPDTNAPVVAITTPPSGIITTTNRLSIAGSAVEPNPNASGIQNIIVTVSPLVGAGPVTTTILRPPASAAGPLSTNWSGIVGLLPGDNKVTVVANDFAGNRSTPVSIQATYRLLEPANDFFVNAITLSPTGSVISVNTFEATKELGEPNHAGLTGGRSAWWKFTPPSNGVLTVSTTNSSFDSVLGVYTGTNVGALTLVASNDDAYDGAPGGFSRVAQGVLSGQTYYIAVDGYDGAGGVVFVTSSFSATTVYHVNAFSAGGGIASPASTDVAANSNLVLTAFPNPYYIFDSWDGSFVSLNNPLTITVTSNINLTAHFLPVAFTEGFESGTFTNLAWTSGGNAPWIVQSGVVAAGQFAARSGYIGHNQSTRLIFSGDFQAGSVYFDYKVSSEENFDLLRFYVDGVLRQQWSGEAGWANYSYPLTAGTHTLEWRYVKDGSLASGADAAFIDNVNLPLAVVPSILFQAQLRIRQATDGTKFLDLTGQPNQTYVFQASSDMANWQSFATNVAVGGFIRVVDPVQNDPNRAYYRAFAKP